MKSVKFILAAAAMLITVSASAQNDYSDDVKYGKWGATVEERAANIEAQNLLKDAIDNKQYDEAIPHLNTLLQNCPAASVNTFTRGVTLYRAKIQRSRSVDEKKEYVQRLVELYDLRAQYFGDRAEKGLDFILDAKARDMIKYQTSVEAADLRGALKAAIDASIEKNYIKYDLASMYFKNICDAYDYNQDETITSTLILDEYERLSPFFNEVAEDDAQYKELFENSFANSSAANCSNLEALFKEKLAADPDNEELLAKAVTLLARRKCTSEFYFDLLVKYYDINPSADTAIYLAEGFLERGDNEKALKYLRETLAIVTDPAAKESLYAKIAVIELSRGNYSSAANTARQLRALNPQNPYSFFVLGQCYASTNCPDDKIGGTSNMWAAYDAMVSASNYFKADPEMQRVSMNLANSYKASFPTQEACFFAEMPEGSTYTITCGFAAGITTTVRYR